MPNCKATWPPAGSSIPRPHGLCSIQSLNSEVVAQSSISISTRNGWKAATATRISAVNDRAVRMFGAHAGLEQMIGKPVSAFWPAESRLVLATLLESVSADRSRLETRNMVLSGTIRNPTIRAWHSAEPKPPGTVFVTINGAADDDRTSWELQASEQRYRKLIEYLPTALWQVDSRRAGEAFDLLKANGIRDIAAYLDQNPDLVEHAKDVVRVTEVNLDAVSLFRGGNAADLIQPVRYIFEAAPGLAERVMVAHFEGRRNFFEETRILAFDGTIIDVLFTVTYPVLPEQLDTTFITMQDISERLNTEQQLRKLQADFAHTGRIATLGELATSIAHEINQPLAAIVTNGETSLRWLARADQNTEKVTQLTTRIVSNARRASEIIHRIRGMAAKHEPEKRLIDLNEVVEEALLFIRHDIDSKSIVLSTAYHPELPRVMGDRISAAASDHQLAGQQRAGNCAVGATNTSDRHPDLNRRRKFDRLFHFRQWARRSGHGSRAYFRELLQHQGCRNWHRPGHLPVDHYRARRHHLGFKSSERRRTFSLHASGANGHRVNREQCRMITRLPSR